MPATSSSYSNRFFGRNQAMSRRRRYNKTVFRLAVSAVFILLYVSCQLYMVPWYFHDYPDQNIDMRPAPDVKFNNLPVRLRSARQKSFHSSVHCVGETHDPATAWKHRSCSYVHLCLDLGGSGVEDPSKSKPPEFFVVSSESEGQFQTNFRKTPAQGKFRYSSTEMLRSKHNTTATVTTSQQQYSPIDVALGGINPSWRAPPKPRVPYQHGIDKIKWAPKVYDHMPFDKYYELDPNVVLVPYHSFAAANVGHLLWDDFLPLYNLLKIFGYEETGTKFDHHHPTKGNKGYQHLLIRVDTMPGLFGTCDLRPKKKEACQRNMERFLPLFGVDPATFSTLSGVQLTNFYSHSKEPPKPYPICAKRAVTGLGWLTDHGIRNHGWMANREEHSLDVALAHNVGRGPELYAFRNFLLDNLGMETSPNNNSPPRTNHDSFRILLSAQSSNHPDRSFGLQIQQKALAKAFPKAEILIADLKTMPLLDQISLVSNQPPKDISTGKLRQAQQQQQQQYKHTIFVSACGGGSATAYFLPRGSSLILYYNEVGGMDYFDNEKQTGGPALLDWDLMNNLGYLKVHWLPIGSMDEREGLDALIALVKHEMDGVVNGLFG